MCQRRPQFIVDIPDGCLIKLVGACQSVAACEFEQSIVYLIDCKVFLSWRRHEDIVVVHHNFVRSFYLFVFEELENYLLSFEVCFNFLQIGQLKNFNQSVDML